MEDFLSENTKHIRYVVKCQQETKQGAGVMQSLSMQWHVVAGTGLSSWPSSHIHLPQKCSKAASACTHPRKGFYTPGMRRNVRSRKPDKLLYNPVLISLHDPNQLPPKTTSSLPKPKHHFQMLICIPAEIPAWSKEEWFHLFYSQQQQGGGQCAFLEKSRISWSGFFSYSSGVD